MNIAIELPTVSERVVVLDCHRLGDNRILKHISSVKEHYHLLRININFFLDGPGNMVEGMTRVIDFVPTKNPYLNGFLMNVLNYLGETAPRIVELMMENGIEKSDCIVFHVHDPYLLGLATRMAKLFPHSRIVYDRHEYYDSWKNRLGLSIPGLFEQMYGRKISEIIFVSRAVSMLPKVLTGKKVTIVPNYPESTMFEPMVVKDKIERFGHGEDVLAVYFGALNLNFDRDTELMFDVMRSVLRARKNVYFEVAGRIYSPIIFEIIKDMGDEFGERMRYLGEIPFSEVVSRTQKAHLGFLLLRPDSPMWSDERPVSPNKIFEYLLSGVVPVVRANLDDKELLEGCALNFDRSSTVEDIVEAILSLLSDRARMRGMMERCLEMGRRSSWESASRGYLECYERLFTSMVEASNE